MKLLTAISLILSLQVSWAQTPEQFCSSDSECTPKMLEIVRLYKTGNSRFLEQRVSGYSGECYHLNFQYSPTSSHHGAFVFKKEVSETTAIGAFSFFASENPYTGFSATELEAVLQQTSQSSALTKTEDPVTLTYDYPESQINYWFRSVGNGEQLIIIGQEAHLLKQNRVFCQMQLH